MIWHLATCQNWCFGQFFISKILKPQFSLVIGVLSERAKSLRAFCPNIYTVPKSNDAMDTEKDIMRKSVFRTPGSTLLKKENVHEPLRVT